MVGDAAQTLKDLPIRSNTLNIRLTCSVLGRVGLHRISCGFVFERIGCVGLVVLSL